MSPRLWTEAEDDILRRHWPRLGSACFAFLEGRSPAGCSNRATRLGLRNKQRPCNRHDQPSLRQCAQMLGFDIGTIRRRLAELRIEPTGDGAAKTLTQAQFQRLKADLLARPISKAPRGKASWDESIRRAHERGARCTLTTEQVAAAVAAMREMR